MKGDIYVLFSNLQRSQNMSHYLNLVFPPVLVGHPAQSYVPFYGHLFSFLITNLFSGDHAARILALEEELAQLKAAKTGKAGKKAKAAAKPAPKTAAKTAAKKGRYLKNVCICEFSTTD